MSPIFCNQRQKHHVSPTILALGKLGRLNIKTNMFGFEARVLIGWLAKVFANQPIMTRASKSDILVLMLRWTIFLTASIIPLISIACILCRMEQDDSGASEGISKLEAIMRQDKETEKNIRGTNTIIHNTACYSYSGIQKIGHCNIDSAIRDQY